jgi:MSHA biogenesis protein MshO
MLSSWPRFLAIRQAGFTLVELVMVIALAGLVAVMISTVMSRPMQGFVDQSRRAELVDLAATALNRMARDIRLAVPNSVRVTGNTLHLLPIAAAGRYRANLLDASGPRLDPPRCTQAGTTCEIEIISPIEPTSSAESHWLVIYNISPDELDDTQAVSVISPKLFTWAGGKMSASLQNFSFKYASLQHRFFLARQSIGYRCDGGRLWRAESDSLDGSNPVESLMADSVSDCSFIYESSNSRSGLVTIRLGLRQGEETITLLQQVHFDNAP